VPPHATAATERNGDLPQAYFAPHFISFHFAAHAASVGSFKNPMAVNIFNCKSRAPLHAIGGFPVLRLMALLLPVE